MDVDGSGELDSGDLFFYSEEALLNYVDEDTEEIEIQVDLADLVEYES